MLPFLLCIFGISHYAGHRNTQRHNISSLEQGTTRHASEVSISISQPPPAVIITHYRMFLIEMVRHWCLQLKWSDIVCDPLKGQSNTEKRATGRTKRQIIWILGQRGGDQGQRGGAPRYSALRETLYNLFCGVDVWADKFSWAEIVMGRNWHGPILLWAEMTRNRNTVSTIVLGP